MNETNLTPWGNRSETKKAKPAHKILAKATVKWTDGSIRIITVMDNAGPKAFYSIYSAPKSRSPRKKWTLVASVDVRKNDMLRTLEDAINIAGGSLDGSVITRRFPNKKKAFLAHLDLVGEPMRKPIATVPTVHNTRIVNQRLQKKLRGTPLFWGGR